MKKYDIGEWGVIYADEAEEIKAVYNSIYKASMLSHRCNYFTQFERAKFNMTRMYGLLIYDDVDDITKFEVVTADDVLRFLEG